jgi:hypothetical protein
MSVNDGMRHSAYPHLAFATGFLPYRHGQNYHISVKISHQFDAIK